MLALAILVIAGAAAVSAHRLDECLQAARIGIAPDRVDLEIDLTPGVAVADVAIAEIDRDRDGVFSADETEVYTARVLAAVVLRIDARALHVEPIDASFPDLQALRRGEGTIRLRARAALPPLADGAHHLFFRNAHGRDGSVYLANALAPTSDRIGIADQRRDGDQRELTIDYVLKPAAATSAPWWWLSLVVAAMLPIATIGRRRSR